MKQAKLILFIALAAIVAASAPRGLAQTAAPATPAAPEVVPNPVSASVKVQMVRSSKNMIAGAEAMPADKYGFKPTPDMSSFGHLVAHIAATNTTLCSKLSGSPAPEGKLEETDGKDKLVAGLRASFDFCSTALANLDDGKLGEQIPLFGGRTVPRAAAWIILSGSWADHYSTEAVYLRLNGILPPSAEPAKK
jgi:DinB superfamily